MSLLITGAGGTVGSALAAELAAQGIEPRLAFHTPAKADAARADGRDAVVVDYGAPESLAPALDGIDTVFLLSGLGPAMAEGEGAVVDAAKAAGVTRVVKLSVWGAEQENFLLGRVHRTSERAIESSGLRWTFLRPNGYMQNFVNYMAGSIKADGVIYQPAGDAAISYLDVRDLARVAATVLTSDGHDGRAYSLSGPAAFTHDQAADVLSRELGRVIRYVPLSDEAARAGMLGAGIPEFYADYLIDLAQFYRRGEGASLTTTVRELTGREPTSFEQFTRDHAGAYA